MTDNRTTELREKLNKLIIEIERLDIKLDSPAYDMTLGEYEQEREKLLDEFEQAIAATLGSDKPPYDELLRCLENDWHIRASWDGLRKFWCIELTEEGVKLRDAARAERTCHNTHENRWFKCSACGYGFTDLYAEDESDINEQPRYCPNCGCKVVDA